MFGALRKHPLIAINTALLGYAGYHFYTKPPGTRKIVPIPLSLQDEANKIPKGDVPKEPYYHMKTRDEHLSEVTKDPNYDLLIIGGGCVGAGAALDGASRGLKCLVIEQKDFGSGTSSKSTKLFHGGVRYLQQVFEFSLEGGRKEKWDLLVEALRERSYTVENAKYMTSTLPIVIPCKSLWEMMFFYAGSALYYAVFLFARDQFCTSKWGAPTIMGATELHGSFPHLDKRYKWGVVYEDGQNNDSRYLLDILLTATVDNYVEGMKGANILNYASFKEFVKDSEGNITGAIVEDRLTGKEIKINSKVVMNASGVFADEIRRRDNPTCEKLINLAVGSHVTLPGSFCNRKKGLIIPETKDGRVIFVLPWKGHTLLGTTDLPYGAPEHDPQVSVEELVLLVNELSQIYPEQSPPAISNSITSRWAGLRPLVKDISVANAGNTKQMSRKHVIEVSKSGLVSVMGGKWTIYRAMGEDSVNTVFKVLERRGMIPPTVKVPAGIPLGAPANTKAASGEEIDQTNSKWPVSQTKQLKLIGEFNKDYRHFQGGRKKEYIRFFAKKVSEHFEIDEKVAKYFVKKYGDRCFDVLRMCKQDMTKNFAIVDENLHLRRGEISYQIKHELALRPLDILFRRNRVGFIEQRHVGKLLPKICDIYQEELKWSNEEKQRVYNESLAELRKMNL